MQVNTYEAALDANPGGMDQATPAREASEPGDQVVFTDGGPGTSKQLAQYFNRGDIRRHMSQRATGQSMLRLQKLLES